MDDLLTRFSMRSDLHQSPMHARLMEIIGWKVLSNEGSQLFLRPLGPLSVAKIQRPQTIDLTWLKAMRRQHRILTLYLEPGIADKTPSVGWRIEPFAHSASALVDIKGNTKQILSSFSQKTRYNIVSSLKKNNITITSSLVKNASKKEMEDLFALRTTWSKAKNVIGYTESLLNAILKSYKNDATLHLAYTKSGECVGALLILMHDRVATYYAAFATPLGYKLFAPTLLTWQAMQSAKENGCDIFDFGGIYDPRYPKMYKNWQGFTKFKSGFNPTVIQYPETRLQLIW